MLKNVEVSLASWAARVVRPPRDLKMGGRRPVSRVLIFALNLIVRSILRKSDLLPCPKKGHKNVEETQTQSTLRQRELWNVPS